MCICLDQIEVKLASGSITYHICHIISSLVWVHFYWSVKKLSIIYSFVGANTNSQAPVSLFLCLTEYKV